LPDGSDPGGARLIEGDVVPVWEWGSGQNLVRLAINHPAFSGSEAPPPQMFDASVRGVPAAIQAIGDLPLSEVTFTWVVGDCTYTVWIGPGYDFEMAREYAARY
jgi:hypothetical protein